LNVVEVWLPPLRDRPVDIPPLVEKTLEAISRASKVPRKSVSPAAMECISGFHWPGNVRELQNVLERALIVCKGDEIRPEDLPDYVANCSASPLSATPALKPLDEIEREYVQRALKICGGNKSRTARALGIDRGTLARKATPSRNTPPA